jgi:hypothetical protein
MREREKRKVFCLFAREMHPSWMSFDRASLFQADVAVELVL